MSDRRTPRRRGRKTRAAKTARSTRAARATRAAKRSGTSKTSRRGTATRKGKRSTKPRGRRYSAAEKAKIVSFADRASVKEAAEKFGASIWSVYRWRQIAHRTAAAGATDGRSADEAAGRKPVRVRVPQSVQSQVVEVWRNNPGFGPSQVRGQLRRVGVRLDTKTIRKILRAHGYTPPKAKPPRRRETKRFEAERPLELVQMDVLHFYVHSEKLYLFLVLDDHSRFLTGWGLAQRETMDTAIEVLEESIRRYGKPEAILTDRGATFHAWNGIGGFDRFLESYDIEHRLAAAEHPQTCGKVESVNRSIQKELIDRVEFRSFLDAKAKIAAWVDTYNHQRTHQGIGGVLVPADRFFGRADQVLARIESSAKSSRRRDPIPPELRTDDGERSISLFQIRFAGGMIELWLFGRCVFRLPVDEASD